MLSRVIVLMFYVVFAWIVPSYTWCAEPHCTVATVNPAATDAGLAAYRAGGNAVDAAIAAALTLGVVDNHNSGLGGGCFILIRQPEGGLLAIDGREMAPAAATRDMFLRDGKAVAELSQTGPLAVGVPGALAAYARALEECGERSLAELILPAAEIAEEGFELDRVYAHKLKEKASLLARFEASRRVLLKSNGEPYLAGETLRQPDLARSYRAIAKQGIDWFYRGPFAHIVGDWMVANGGILTAEDFAAYRAKIRAPLVTRYRDWKIIGFPPPSSGGVHVAQILNILETFDLAEEQRRNSSQANHLIVESMKLAFADRAHWLGDADYVDVPRGLIDKGYAQRLAARIDRDRAIDVPCHSTPPHATEELFGKHTTHIATADSEGYWVAITATVNTAFGSKVIIPGTGIVLNNEMDDFSAQPGVPNAFGLLGAENNSVAPGKRPLSSMSPTIVLDKDDHPVLTVGAAGGPKIITQVVLALVRRLDFEKTLHEAVAEPRLHHQWRPDRVVVEKKMSQQKIDGLRSRGHKIETIFYGGITQAIGIDNQGRLRGVHDPRTPGKAASASRALQATQANH